MTMINKNSERSAVCEIIKGKIYFAVLQRPEDLKGSWLPRPALCFSTENELVYEPFFQDFGPLNIACTYRFCWKLHGLLRDAESHGRCVCYCSSLDPKMKPNAAVLLGAYLVLFENWEPDAAYAPLAAFEPFLPFRDPTCGVSTYHLTVLDCIRAVVKGKKVGWINFNTFNLEEYEYFEQVENGDLNWIVPNKLVAFSGPAPKRSQMYGYRSLVPEDYVEYYKRVWKHPLYFHVAISNTGSQIMASTTMISTFLMAVGFFSCPPERIVQRFLEIVEETNGALAVHCKAGLGRTGVLIGCYIMKHYKFTANEAIGYLRLMRPGSVIGPQQHFLRDMQARMWKAGDGMRRHRSDSSKTRQPVPPGGNVNVPLVTLWNDASPWSQGRTVLSSKTSSTSPALRRLASERMESMSTVRTPGAGSRQLHWEQAKYKSSVLTDSSKDSRRTQEDHNSVAGSTNTQCKSPNKRLGIEAAIEGLSLSSKADPLNQMRKACVNDEADMIYESKPAMSSSNFSSNSKNGNSGDGSAGILRNASFSARSQPTDVVCTHRTINAAGQPRKMVMPVLQQPRESSPVRRKSASPLRTGLKGYELGY